MESGERALQCWMADAEVDAQSAELRRLIAAACAGDLSAFEQIMMRTGHAVMRTARRLLGNSADAEEAVQEVFLRVYKYLHRFDRRRPFEPWLYRMTVNVCNDIASRRAGQEHWIPVESVDLPAADTDADERIHREEQREMIDSALGQLTRQQRTVLVLRDLQGLSTAEIAATLKVSEATVRSHLSGARLRLKQLIFRKLRRRS